MSGRASITPKSISVEQRVAANQRAPELIPAPSSSEDLLRELADLRTTVEELRHQNAELATIRQTLEVEQQRYREAFELASDCYVLTDLDGIIRKANRAVTALLSVRQGFLVGKSLMLFVDEAERATLETQLAPWRSTDRVQTKRLRGTIHGRTQLRVHKGATFPAEFTISPARDGHDQIIGMRWVLRDLSESIQTLQALQDSEYHYRTLFNNVGDAIFIHNLTGRFLEVNRMACESLGYTRDELLQMIPADLTAPDMVEQISVFMARLRQEDHIFFEMVLIRRDGAAFPVELNSRMIEYAGGPAVLSIVRDITVRKRDEAALARRVKQLVLLNDVGRKIAAIWDPEQVINRAAHLVYENFGYHHVALFIVDHEQGQLVMKAKAGNFVSLFPPEHRIPLGRGMVGWVTEHGERLLANDVRAEPHYINFYPDVIPTCSELSVPIRLGEQTLGVFDIQSPHIDAFDENDVRVMETLADQIAIALADPLRKEKKNR